MTKIEEYQLTLEKLDGWQLFLLEDPDFPVRAARPIGRHAGELNRKRGLS